MSAILEHLAYVGLVGGAAGGIIATLLWAIERIRGRPFIEPTDPKKPLTREEMIVGLRAMAADPQTTPDNRERALTRLQTFEALDGLVEDPDVPDASMTGDSPEGRYSETPSFPALGYFEIPPFEGVKMPSRKWIFGGALLAAWSGFGWLQYDWANRRIDECYDLLSGSQGAICIRNAIETRDFVITWAIGIPLILLVLAAAMSWIVSQTRE